MTLSFSKKWPKSMGELAGKPNYFPEKIWKSLPKDLIKRDYGLYLACHNEQFGTFWDFSNCEINPKSNTIREDPHDRWKAGMDIHMVINNRTKNRFQFAPTIKCVSTQKVEIEYYQYMGDPIPIVRIDNLEYTYDPYFQFSDPESCEEIKKLAINDGFDSVEDFFAYFNKDFIGKIIHWTDLRY